MLAQSCYTLATLLELPEKDTQKQEEIVNAVCDWFQNHIDWLLILDNADDPALVRNFLPSATHGHVLITTHSQAVGRIAQSIGVDKMTSKHGDLFLLRCTGFLGLKEKLSLEDEFYPDAIHIAEILDGLPLALDYAECYIERSIVVQMSTCLYTRNIVYSY